MILNHKAKKDSDFALPTQSTSKSEELSKAGLEFHYVKRALAAVRPRSFIRIGLIRRQEYRLFPSLVSARCEKFAFSERV